MTRSLILATVVRWVAPVLIAFAVVLFLKGHNSPGGGFIAGLLTAAAVVLRFIALGRDASSIRSDRYVGVVTLGLAVATATAIVPTLLGYPFFTHTFGHVHVPLVGDAELASAALFDLGVYLVVVGNVVTVIAAMTEKQSPDGSRHDHDPSSPVNSG